MSKNPCIFELLPFMRIYTRTRVLHAIKLSFRFFAEIQCRFFIVLGKFPLSRAIFQNTAYYDYSIARKGMSSIFWWNFPFFIGFLALSLFMALALGTNYHYSAVSFDYFALIAHRFYRRSNFHFLFSLLISLFVELRLATPRDSAFRQIVRAHF